MKKLLSSLLIFSTLSLCFVPGISCSAADAAMIKISFDKPSGRAPSYRNKVALKQAILGLAKDKKFTDEVVKNYRKAHEDPLLLKLLKLPFKITFKIIFKILDYTVGYWIGKTVCALIEKLFKNVVVPAVCVCYLYKKFPLFAEFTDSFLSSFDIKS